MTQPLSAEAAVIMAETNYKAGAYAEAAAILGQINDNSPLWPTAIRLLGLCQLRLGDAGRALALLEQARSLTPADPLAQLHYGLGLYANGRHPEAAAIFRACQALLPGDPAPSLNLASALLALGDHREALSAARKARLRAPKLPQAHYTVGMAQLAGGHLDAAENAFREALRLAPGFADAWVNLGLVRYRLSDMDGARSAMRRALAAVPHHRAATANLGAFLRLTGDAAGGEAMLRDSLARDPASAEARVNLAAGLLQEERAAEALALLDAVAPPTEPRLADHVLAQRALALLQLGRPAEARTTLDAIGQASPELAPLLFWRRLLLATQEGDNAAARAFAGQMEAALHAPLLPEHSITARFDLAKFWSGQHEPDKAFPHWVEGHRLLGRLQLFSRDRHRAFVTETIARFDRERLRHGPRATNRDPAQVFIVGMPRSGTTLAEQIVAAHRDVFGAGERNDLAATFRAFGGAFDTACAAGLASGLDTPALDRAATEYLAQLHALAPGAARVVDKMPGNFAWLGLVGLMLPGARIIHCVRDPRDIGLSIFSFRFHGHHPYAHHLAVLGWYIRQHDRLMAHWRDALPNPILTLALRDWIDDFDATLHRVLDFLELPYDPACERFYESDTRVRTVSRAQVRQPVNARGLDRWRPYERHLRPLIAALEADFD
jgi:tetratricopeptide (TPR) repeat protein